MSLELAGRLPFNKEGDFWSLLWTELTRIDGDVTEPDVPPLVLQDQRSQHAGLY
jgi:hypothetical protein